MALSHMANRSTILFHLFTVTISLTIPFATPLTFSFSSFSPKYDDDMAYQRAFPDPSGAIQLTDKNAGLIGRATYKQPLRLWDRATGNLADFTTHFSFVIDSLNISNYGDGLAFFLAPTGSAIPGDSGGGSFGLTKGDELFNSTSNPFVAVEFDIYANSWDPFPDPLYYDHVGIDINSVNSSNAVSDRRITKTSLTELPTSGINYFSFFV